MIRLAGVAQAVLQENLKFNNWKVPDSAQLKLEFKVEHELKHLSIFKDEKDFLDKIKQGKVLTLSAADDRRIANRSHTKSFDELHHLIQMYGSYPKYRNEDTLRNIYKGFKEGRQMDLPIIIEFINGNRRIFSGNTRLDIAFQLDVNPIKVLLIYADI